MVKKYGKMRHGSATMVAMAIRPTRKQIRKAIAAIEARGEPVTLNRVCAELSMSPKTVNKALDALRMKRFPVGRPIGTATVTRG